MRLHHNPPCDDNERAHALSLSGPRPVTDPGEENRVASPARARARERERESAHRRPPTVCYWPLPSTTALPPARSLAHPPVRPPARRPPASRSPLNGRHDGGFAKNPVRTTRNAMVVVQRAHVDADVIDDGVLIECRLPRRHVRRRRRRWRRALPESRLATQSTSPTMPVDASLRFVLAGPTRDVSRQRTKKTVRRPWRWR